MVTKQWTAIHRKRHAKCVIEDDPQSSMILGIDKVLWEGLDLYRAAARDPADNGARSVSAG